MDIRQSKRRIELARKCLAMISRIASRGACSENPEHIGYALQELSQVLCERTGSEDRLFPPIAVDRLRDLNHLIEELSLVDAASSDMRLSHPDQSTNPGIWN